MSIEAMKQALEALEKIDGAMPFPVGRSAITALRTAIEQAEKQEPVAWMWHQAPVKTQWGDDMVVADIAIDKDHTVSIYCERDQAAKVAAMFTPPAAQQEPWEQFYPDMGKPQISSPTVQRQWVGLTEKDFSAINQSCLTKLQAATSAESILKEKNT